MIADTRGNTLITNVTMHGVGKVNGAGPFRELENVPAGSKDVHLIWEQVDFDVLDKFKRVARPLLHFKQALNPLAGAGMRDIRARLFALVEPMGGDAVIGHIFHFVRANLDLDRYAVHSL